MSSPDSDDNKNTKKDDDDGLIKTPKGKWLTPLFFVLIFIILVFLSCLLIAYSQVGSQCSSVPVSSGEMWYECAFGSSY